MSPEEIFASLGFNALEAEVYVALLTHGPQTAYRIGKLLNRPTANVYKAVDVLAAKGALELEESESRICRAIPISALAQQLERDFGKRVSKAAALLGAIEQQGHAEGIYKLQSVEAVLQRAREMLARASKTVVADFFPAPLDLLLPEIRAAVARGCRVFVQAYETVEVTGAAVVVPAGAQGALTQWRAQQLNLAVDGREILVALFNHDMTELVQANYSNNLYLACIVYSGMKSEQQLHTLAGAGSMEELAAMRSNMSTFANSEVPGLEQLFRQYRGLV